MKHRIIWGLVASLLLAGCSGDYLEDLKEYVKEVKLRTPTPIKPLPPVPQLESFVYQSKNCGNGECQQDRRDPFEITKQTAENSLSEAINGVKPPDPSRRKEELEQYPLDGLRMVGTIEQEGIRWALLIVKTIDNKLFRVQAGNHIGQNYGQITRIAPERIELTEIIPDGSGGWKEQQSLIGISSSEGENSFANAR